MFACACKLICQQLQKPRPCGGSATQIRTANASVLRRATHKIALKRAAVRPGCSASNCNKKRLGSAGARAAVTAARCGQNAATCCLKQARQCDRGEARKKLQQARCGGGKRGGAAGGAARFHQGEILARRRRWPNFGRARRSKNGAKK